MDIVRVLAVETSCDETAVCIVEADLESWKQGKRTATIIDEIIYSQIPDHQAYGGVVPELAAREHVRVLPSLIERLKEQGALEGITHFCVTRGPGLKGCLLIGHTFIKAMASALKKPFIGVNHLEGHVCAALIDNPTLSPPFLILLVSGGHTQLLKCMEWGVYEILSQTLDDAAGEAFDKSASLLGFPYPGGALLAQLGDSVNTSDKISFPLPAVMKGRKDLSFSGLKTAISLLITRLKNDGNLEEYLPLIAHSVQKAIVDAIMDKVYSAKQHYRDYPLVLTGGVAANRYLRDSLCSAGIELIAPRARHCTDNATMIAYAGLLRIASGSKSSLNETVLPRWPLDDLS